MNGAEIAEEKEEQLSVEINAAVLEGVREAVVLSTQTILPDTSYGKKESVGYCVSGREFLITLKRNVIGADKIDFYGLEEFNLTVHDAGGTSVYMQCLWQEISDEFDVNGRKRQRLVIKSPCRIFYKE